MATTVTYKGETLTTATNQTKTLLTQGKYMEDDVTITDTSPTFTTQTKSRTFSALPGGTQTSTIRPDAGYDGLSQVDVTINAIPTAGKQTVTVNAPSPTLSFDSATGVVTGTTVAQTVDRYPIISDGYIKTNSTVRIKDNGDASDTYQVPTQAAQTITPSSVQQTISAGVYLTGTQTIDAIPSDYVGTDIPRRTASDLTESDGIVTAPSGYYENNVTKSITLVPYAIRPDAEHLQTYTYDKYAVADEGLTLPAYATSAQTIKAAANLTPTITVDMDNYRYFVVERFLSIPEYSVTSKSKGRAEYTWCSYFYEVTRAAANEFPTIIDPTKKITSVQTLWASNQLYRLLYWTSSSAIALYATNGYGVYQTPSTPSLSGTTLTLKSPVLGARGSTTYFTSTYMNALTDIRYQYVIDVYRAPLNNLGIYSWGQDDMLQHMLDCINDTNHKLT